MAAKNTGCSSDWARKPPSSWVNITQPSRWQRAQNARAEAARALGQSYVTSMR